MAVDGLSGFGSDGVLRLAPNDPDAAYLMAKYPGRYRFTTPEEAAPYVVQLGREGNPFSVVASIPGPVADTYTSSYLSGVRLGQAERSTGMSTIDSSESSIPTSSGFGSPGYMLNLGDDPGGGFNPQAIPDGIAQLHSYALGAYGSTELGMTRFSSQALEQNKSGIRMGQMPRIVVPAWANREGKPF